MTPVSSFCFRMSSFFHGSLSKVALWYQGWKDRFPENLRSDPRVMAQFSAALTLMEQVNCGVVLLLRPTTPVGVRLLLLCIFVHVHASWFLFLLVVPDISPNSSVSERSGFAPCSQPSRPCRVGSVQTWGICRLVRELGPLDVGCVAGKLVALLQKRRQSMVLLHTTNF